MVDLDIKVKPVERFQFFNFDWNDAFRESVVVSPLNFKLHHPLYAFSPLVDIFETN